MAAFRLTITSCSTSLSQDMEEETPAEEAMAMASQEKGTLAEEASQQEKTPEEEAMAGTKLGEETIRQVMAVAEALQEPP